MGDPKLKRKTFRKPMHPWQKERIEREIELLKTFGLKNKRELWKVDSLLKKFMRQAKRLIALHGPQAEKEEKELLGRMRKFGYLSGEGKLEDVLSLDVKDFLERRLATLVQKRQLARTVRQARQFIVHNHIMVGGHTVSAPSYLVTVEEEGSICFAPRSELTKTDHPQRFTPPTPEQAAAKDEKQRKKEGERAGRMRGQRRGGRDWRGKRPERRKFEARKP